MLGSTDFDKIWPVGSFWCVDKIVEKNFGKFSKLPMLQALKVWIFVKIHFTESNISQLLVKLEQKLKHNYEAYIISYNLPMKIKTVDQSSRSPNCIAKVPKYMKFFNSEIAKSC